MRIYFILLVVLLSISIGQAQVLAFDHGKVEFHTSNIMSDIEAVSNELEASLDLESGTVDIRIPITSFEFEYEMMQDHFNEEYLESDRFPDATFKGNIVQDIGSIEGATQVDVTGALSIHGVTKSTSFTATLTQQDDFLKVKCVFPIVFKDFDVEEPSILVKTLAKDVEMKAILYLK